jgi:hypothetical protein
MMKSSPIPVRFTDVRLAKLRDIAKQKKVSISELIRDAVYAVYFGNEDTTLPDKVKSIQEDTDNLAEGMGGLSEDVEKLKLVAAQTTGIVRKVNMMDSQLQELMDILREKGIIDGE